MRKVTETVVSAWKRGESAKCGNTATDGQTIFLHGNAIVTLEGGTVYVSSAGWETSTTKERLNGVDGVRVHQSKGQWFLNGEIWEMTEMWTAVV